VRAHGRAGKHIKIADFPKILPPKSSAFEFLNLTLHAREARGTAKPHWLSLVGGKESQCENQSVPMMVM